MANEHHNETNGQAAKAQAHVAAAKAIASEPELYDLTPTFNLLCTERKPHEQEPSTAAAPANRTAARIPERSQWYVEPVKVFDNLYNVGTAYYVWAVTTSEGIILLNSGRDYAAEAVVEGLQKMGLDPASVKYVIVHNADPAHYGAAKLFQDRYHSRIMDSNEAVSDPGITSGLKLSATALRKMGHSQPVAVTCPDRSPAISSATPSSPEHPASPSTSRHWQRPSRPDGC